MKKLFTSLAFVCMLTLSSVASAYVWTETYVLNQYQMQIRVINTGPVHVACQVDVSNGMVYQFSLPVGLHYNIPAPINATYVWSCW